MDFFKNFICTCTTQLEDMDSERMKSALWSWTVDCKRNNNDNCNYYYNNNNDDDNNNNNSNNTVIKEG